MIKNLRKKGFTIVELVIVIAVIAILAAILIPTFSGIIKKANIASDTAMAKNMNTVLALAKEDGAVMEDISDVLVVINEAGYIIENLNPTTQGYYFAWDSELNQILFLDEQLNIHYQFQGDVGARVNWWTTVSSANEAEFVGNQEINFYFENDIFGKITLEKLVSVDTGFYKHGGTLEINDTAVLTTVLRGQFNEVNINCPNATIAQYGYIAEANIIAIAETSFDVHGLVTTLVLTKGHVHNVGGQIGALNAPDGGSGAIKVTNNGLIGAPGIYGTIPDDVVTGNAAGAATGATLSISNATELQNFAYAVNNGADYSEFDVEITKDIDLKNRTWTPIGNSIEKPFKGGTIKGNNHKIINLTNSGYVGGSSYTSESKTSVNPYGLFAYVNGSTIITDLEVNVAISSSTTAGFGAFIGCATEAKNVVGGYTKKIELEFINCTSSGSLQGTDKTGGFIGTGYGGTDLGVKSVTFTNCTNNASITGVNTLKNCRIGGFVGTLGKPGATFTDCTNNGKIENKASKGNHMTAAGFVGYTTLATRTSTSNQIIFTRCKNEGLITCANFSNSPAEKAVHDFIGLVQGVDDNHPLDIITINGVSPTSLVANDKNEHILK